MQCCNYARASCHTSHSITVPKLENAFIEGLKFAVENKEFTITPVKKKTDTPTIDYDKLISIEEKMLVRAKAAYLAEVDTIEQYAQNKAEITKRIENLKAKQNEATSSEINIDAYVKRVLDILDFIQRDDVTEEAKNDVLHTIIEKVVFEKAKGNLAIFFRD